MNKLKDRTLPILLLGWLLITVTAYFVVQKPWPGPSAIRSLRTVFDIVLAGAVVLAGGSLGARIIRSKGKAQPLEIVCLQAGIGLGIISLLVLALGAAGLVGPLSSWLVLLIILFFNRRHGAGWLTSLIRGLAASPPRGVISRAAFSVVALLLSISLLEALAPPLKWDSLVYHLALPQEYLKQGQVGFVSGNLFVGFPQLAEMIYTWAMALGSGTTSAVTGWIVGFIAILGLAGLTGRRIGEDGFWLVPAFLLAGASLWQGLAWAYVDHWVLLYGLLLFIALDQYMITQRRGWLWLAGAFIGLAASTKYTGALLGLAAVLWLSIGWYKAIEFPTEDQIEGPNHQRTRLQRLGILFQDIAHITLVAMVVFSPWLVKNWLSTGNPLYPFLLPGREVDSLRQTFHAQGQSFLSLGSLPILPWLVTILGVEGGAGFSSSIGPFYLALIPGLLVRSPTERPADKAFLIRLIGVAVLAWLLWGFGGMLADPLSRSRHYYGFLPLLAILAMFGYERLAAVQVGELRIGWVISRLVIFAFFLVGVDAIFHLAQRNPLPVITGQQPDVDYLTEQLGWYGPTMSYLERLPDGSKVEMLWEARAYYCPQECLPDVILDKWWYWRRTIGDGASIRRHLREQGVTHVLIYDFGANFERRNRELQSQSDWDALDAFRQDQLVLLQGFGDGYSLYTWRVFE